MKNLSLRIKLVLMLVLPFAVTGIVFYFGVSGMAQINRKLDTMANVTSEKMKLSANIHQSMSHISKTLRNAILANSGDRIEKYAAAIEEYDSKLEEVRRRLYELMDGEGRGILDRFAEKRQEYLKVEKDILSLARENSDEKAFELGANTGRELFIRITELMEQIDRKNEKDLERDRQESDEQYVSARNLMIYVTLAGIFLAACLGFYSIRSVTLPFRSVFRGVGTFSEKELMETSEKLEMIVEGISGNQIADSSQSLAQGAAEQAAAIEETGSSLEEMASMIKLNADNANQADRLMKETIQVVASANESMNDLTGSMEEISQASGEISKIIKTIDEIAFQTNLLALNAAVEAARAGEAGAGFAVVADEVRNLALRSAEAAKNTSAMIENTIRKINEGSELVAKTNEAFRQVAESAAKVGELLAEIASASNEQALGIEQVSRATSEMDKIVQQNAANAEQLSAHAQQLDDIVNQLMSVTTGGRKGETEKTDLAPRTNQELVPRTDRKGETLLISKKEKEKEKEKDSPPAAPSPAEEISPEQLIPLDDDDFEDF